MQNEWGGREFINKNGNTKGRGRKTVYTIGQGTRQKNRLVGDGGSSRLCGKRGLGSSSRNHKLGPGDGNSCLSGQKNQRPGRNQEATQKTRQKERQEIKSKSKKKNTLQTYD